ncbi:unnamed protein product, partial [marine sediment metagenome]
MLRSELLRRVAYDRCPQLAERSELARGHKTVQGTVSPPPASPAPPNEAERFCDPDRLASFGEPGVRKERNAMAGEMRQEWTWRDIFRSIGLAFSFTRLVIGFLGLACFAAADGLTTWGVMAAEKAGVVPGTWAMRGIVCGRWIVAGYIFLFTAAAIAYSAKGELLEGEGAGVKESIGFVFRKFGAIFWTPVLFWGFVGVMGGLAFVFFMLPGLIMRLFGATLLVSLCWYAATFFFTVLFAVLAMLGVLAFLFSLFLAPPVIATRQEGALDATLDSIDLMRGKGAFWVAILVLM